jgi:hypothetical protein
MTHGTQSPAESVPLAASPPTLHVETVRTFDRRQAMGIALIAIACVFAVIVYGSFGRPIWIDEFLHFALGSHRSTAEAWSSISASVVEVNHGQTGAYMMLDYWLLKAFGAEAVALRLPSLVSALWMLVAATLALRLRGHGTGWQLIVVLAFMGQSVLMHFAGEARPYMPLAAATVGALTYYLARSEGRVGGWYRALGIGSIVLGTSMHPYFALYWAAMFLFGYMTAVMDGRARLRWSAFFAQVDLPLTIAGTVLFFGLAALTWLRGGPSFTFDPFQWIRNDGLYKTFVDISHMEFVGRGRRWVMLAVFAAPFALAVTWARAQWRALARPFVAPTVLLYLALMLSIVLAYLSYRRQYWVLPRQWVASMALVPVAVVWAWAEVSRILAARHRALGAMAVAALVLSIGLGALGPVRLRLRELANPPAVVSSALGAVRADTSVAPTDNDGWVTLANLNLQAGGEVWDVFRKYYGR